MKKTFWNEPVTWGGIAKLNVFTSIIGVIIIAIGYVYYFTDILTQIKAWFQDKFHKKPNYNKLLDDLE